MPPKAAPNLSYWTDSLDREHPLPALEGPLDVDLALVGGGYTSLVTAITFKRANPGAEVAILESDYLGFGGSGRNAGMVLQKLHPGRARAVGKEVLQETYRRTLAVVDWIEDLCRETGRDCELERCGFFQVGFYPAHQRQLAKAQATYAGFGFELGLLDRHEIQQAIHTERFTSGLLYPGAASMHPGKFVSVLKQAALAAGVRIFENSPAVRVRQGRQVEIQTPAGQIRAQHAVLGLNAYLTAAGLRAAPDPAVALKSFIVLTEELSDEQWAQIGWQGRQGYCDLRRVHNYVRVTGRRILFGGRVTYHFGVSQPAQEAAICENLRQELVRTFPSLSGVRMEHTWSGPVSISWNRIPAIVRRQNLWSVAGYSGNGASLAIVCGQALADLVGGRDQEWSNLLYLKDKPLPLPGEPFRFIGFKSSYYGMKFLDWLDSLSR